MGVYADVREHPTEHMCSQRKGWSERALRAMELLLVETAPEGLKHTAFPHHTASGMAPRLHQRRVAIWNDPSPYYTLHSTLYTLAFTLLRDRRCGCYSRNPSPYPPLHSRSESI
jgi:hypothetical protein